MINAQNTDILTRLAREAVSARHTHPNLERINAIDYAPAADIEFQALKAYLLEAPEGVIPAVKAAVALVSGDVDLLNGLVLGLRGDVDALAGRAVIKLADSIADVVDPAENTVYWIGAAWPYKIYIWEGGAWRYLSATNIDLEGFLKREEIGMAGGVAGYSHGHRAAGITFDDGETLECKWGDLTDNIRRAIKAAVVASWEADY